MVFKMASVMAVTAFTFVIVQGAAFAESSENIADEDDKIQEETVSKEKYFVLTGFVFSTFCFFWYLFWSYSESISDDDSQHAIKITAAADLRTRKIISGKIGMADAVWVLVSDIVVSFSSSYGAADASTSQIIDQVVQTQRSPPLSLLLSLFFFFLLLSYYIIIDPLT
jgi:heme/copper-type cytochrome/quinol oxidase subunit 3